MPSVNPTDRDSGRKESLAEFFAKPSSILGICVCLLVLLLLYVVFQTEVGAQFIADNRGVAGADSAALGPVSSARTMPRVKSSLSLIEGMKALFRPASPAPPTEARPREEAAKTPLPAAAIGDADGDVDGPPEDGWPKDLEGPKGHAAGGGDTAPERGGASGFSGGGGAGGGQGSGASARAEAPTARLAEAVAGKAAPAARPSQPSTGRERVTRGVVTAGRSSGVAGGSGSKGPQALAGSTGMHGGGTQAAFGEGARVSATGASAGHAGPASGGAAIGGAAGGSVGGAGASSGSGAHEAAKDEAAGLAEEGAKKKPDAVEDPSDPANQRKIQEYGVAIMEYENQGALARGQDQIDCLIRAYGVHYARARDKVKNIVDDVDQAVVHFEKDYPSPAVAGAFRDLKTNLMDSVGLYTVLDNSVKYLKDGESCFNVNQGRAKTEECYQRWQSPLFGLDVNVRGVKAFNRLVGNEGTKSLATIPGDKPGVRSYLEDKIKSYQELLDSVRYDLEEFKWRSENTAGDMAKDHDLPYASSKKAVMQILPGILPLERQAPWQQAQGDLGFAIEQANTAWSHWAGASTQPRKIGVFIESYRETRLAAAKLADGAVALGIRPAPADPEASAAKFIPVSRMDVSECDATPDENRGGGGRKKRRDNWLEKAGGDIAREWKRFLKRGIKW
ncbi:MAG: hypothetical protein HY925_04860 [Elusimicrobia bacterium]|nr:hypothetical protein [Elusimicrobiota bacterium]